MGLALIPDGFRDDIYQIEAAQLQAAGIRLLLMDLDNTLAPYRAPLPDERLCLWVRALQSAGLRVQIISNSRHPGRTERFAQALGVEFVTHAGKPKPGAFLRQMEAAGVAPAQTLMLGDQIFTDIWGAHNAGLRAILVHPVEFGTVFRALRYVGETPFRLLGKQRSVL